MNKLAVMKRSWVVEIFFIYIVVVSTILFFSSCSEKSLDGMIVYSQVSKTEQVTNSIKYNPLKYQAVSQIYILNPNQPEKTPKLISDGFFSACDPEVSYDGKFIIFAAQKEESGTWQIWEMNLKNQKAIQITSYPENCVNPAYLPGGRFVFSKLTNTDKTQPTGDALFTGALDGTNISQITFNPHIYTQTSVLQDGRILTVSRQIFPDIGVEKLMVLRPDGTKQELFYEGNKGSDFISNACETEEGNIVFIESEDDNITNGNIISVRYNRPLHSFENLSFGLKGDFRSVNNYRSGSLLVSYRPDGKETYSLYEFSPENKTLSLIYENENGSISEAVLVKQHERPRKLPSEVDTGVKTGLMMCQDINFYGIEPAHKNRTDLKAEIIEVIGIDSILGIADVEEDGSFYLKILADTPFRFRTITSDGKEVDGPGNWIYLRPNERRGCVGCHVSNEISPFNRQPLSVKKEPLHIPKHIEGIKEKQVELE